MDAVKNERSDTWHLLGSRGCGVDPEGTAYGEVRSGNWATIRDTVTRDEGDPCSRCRWPPM
jgi:hypothetical protein